MKNYWKITLGIFFSGIFLVPSVFGAGSCELIAPESCYFMNEPLDQSQSKRKNKKNAEEYTVEKWLWDQENTSPTENQYSYCELFEPKTGAEKNTIDFSEMPNGTAICNALKQEKGFGSLSDCSGIVEVSEIQNIIRPFIEKNRSKLWPEVNFTLTRDHFQNYHHTADYSKDLGTDYWFKRQENQIIECAEDGLLSDGKYGHCTRYALQLYLDQECFLDKNPFIIIGNGKDSEEEFDTETNTMNIELIVSDESLGSESCENYLLVFKKDTGEVVQGYGNTEAFCTAYNPSGKCNIYDLAGENPNPEKDYEAFKKTANEVLAQQCSLLVLGGSPFANSELNNESNSGKVEDETFQSWKSWGSDYEIPNGTLHDCNGNFSMIFNKDETFSMNTSLKNESIRTQDVCNALGASPCSLSTIITAVSKQNNNKSYSPNDNYHDLKEAIRNILKKDCLDESFVCENNPNLKIPSLSSNQALYTPPSVPNWLFPTSFAQEAGEEGEDKTDIFGGTAICLQLFGKKECTVGEIRKKIPENEVGFKNYWNTDAFNDITGIPKTYIKEAQAEKCKTKSNTTGNSFDKCTRLALAKYLLVEECKPCPKEPNYYEKKYDDYQTYKKIKGAKTPCECGDDFDYEHMICPSAFFQWNEDQLRPKYLTGSNWENRQYRGNASDLTFWMQKFGNKITRYAAALAVLFIVFNGFMLVTAAGDEDQIGKAKKGIQWTFIGLLLLTFAYIIVKTVISLAY